VSELWGDSNNVDDDLRCEMAYPNRDNASDVPALQLRRELSCGIVNV